MAQEIGNPLCVFGVRLASWHRLDMLGIDYEYLDVAFKEIEHRFPIHPGSFESDMATSQLQQPVQQTKQLGSRCAVAAKCFGDLPIFLLDQGTGSHRFLVNIQPRTPGIEDFHLIAPRYGRHSIFNGCSEAGELGQRFSSACSKCPDFPATQATMCGS